MAPKFHIKQKWVWIKISKTSHQYQIYPESTLNCKLKQNQNIADHTHETRRLSTKWWLIKLKERFFQGRWLRHWIAWNEIAQDVNFIFYFLFFNQKQEMYKLMLKKTREGWVIPTITKNLLKIWINCSTIQGIHPKDLDYNTIYKDVISSSSD